MKQSLTKQKKLLKKINAMQDYFRQMDESELKDYQNYLNDLFAKKGQTNDFIVKAFAYGREVTWRVLGKFPYDVQILGGLAMNEGKVAQLLTGSGKAVTFNTKIPTPTGWKLAAAVEEGDFIFGPDGQPTKVTGRFPQGLKEVYEVETRDGRIINCSLDHLWDVYEGYKTKTTKTVTTEYMFNKMQEHKVEGKRGNAFQLPTAGVAQYPEKELPLSPYVMGYILGNGNKNRGRCFEISSADEEVVGYIAEELGAVGKKLHETNYNWRFYREPGKPLHVADVAPEYETLLTQLYSYEKYIPQDYLENSEEVRWSLLQGLLDSDGSIGNYGTSKRYNVRFSTTSISLKDTILELAYSLGLSATASISRKQSESVKRDQFTICFNVPHSIKPKMFRLGRKKAIAEEAASMPERRKNYGKMAIVDIRKTYQQEEMVCFTVDNDAHLFLVGNFVVTHNTITEILPAYINTFGGKKVHIITVNDYLAKRDAEEMGEVFSYLGLTTGRIWPNMPDGVRRQAYKENIIYGTNSEFGFDYLKDNMVTDASARVQTGLDFCIIDEADSVMIDEAKTPLIISAETESKLELYQQANLLASKMVRGQDIVDVSKLEKIDKKEVEEARNKRCHFRVDVKNRSVVLTDTGIRRVKKFFNVRGSLSSMENAKYLHHITQALLAHATMDKDKNYIVQDGEIVIVDEFTGRKMEGRRFSDGLHQALEAKEFVEIQPESETSATITLQNFFRLYDKLSGMSGTVASENKELDLTYGTPVVVVPPHKPVIRVDEKTAVFATEADKFDAVLSRTLEEVDKGRPVLIGTSTIEKSMALSQKFQEAGLAHAVLNAKEVERESYIVAQAGRPSAVTIATNMAGRGTDIKLGGNAEYIVRERLMKMGYTSKEVYHAASANLEEEEYDYATVRLAELWKRELEQEEAICARDRERVMEAGGLFIIGTELADSKRVDDQLRGRAGRQGEPGGSKFYISLDDELMRSVQASQVSALKDLIVVKDRDDAGKNIRKAVESIQRSIQNQSYEQRKDILEYDEVDNLQRKSVYAFRNDILDGKDFQERYEAYAEKGLQLYAREKWEEIYESFSDLEDGQLEATVYAYEEFLAKHTDNTSEFVKEVSSVYRKGEAKVREYAINTFYDLLVDELNQKEDALPNAYLTLMAIDVNWKEYIVAMQNMKDSVRMTYMSQVKPIEKYKQESSKMFNIFKECVALSLAERLSAYLIQSR